MEKALQLISRVTYDILNIDTFLFWHIQDPFILLPCLKHISDSSPTTLLARDSILGRLDECSRLGDVLLICENILNNNIFHPEWLQDISIEYIRIENFKSKTKPRWLAPRCLNFPPHQDCHHINSISFALLGADQDPQKKPSEPALGKKDASVNPATLIILL